MDFRITEGVEKLKTLTRQLRGGRADPSEAIPQVHGIVKSQLRNIQSMYEMYQDGDDATLGSSIKTLFRESPALPSSREDSKEIATLGDPEKDFAVRQDTSPSLDAIPDSLIVEQFEPSEFLELIQQLQELDSILEDAKSVVQSPDLVNSRRLSSEKKTPFKFDSDPGSKHAHHFKALQNELRKMSHRNGAGIRRKLSLPNLSKFGIHGRRLNDAPAICSKQCAPTDESCMCQRLADCAKKLSHYDMALMFADGYIEADSSNKDFGGFTVDDVDLRLFDTDDNAYNVFTSINSTATSIHSDNSASCTSFLEEFHTSCPPDDSSTCSTGNTRSFQMSVDEVCDSINQPTKLLFSAIGDVFDGYASTDGKMFAWISTLRFSVMHLLTHLV